MARCAPGLIQGTAVSTHFLLQTQSAQVKADDPEVHTRIWVTAHNDDAEASKFFGLRTPSSLHIVSLLLKNILFLTCKMHQRVHWKEKSSQSHT